jgi:hypothetical protein
MIAASFLQVLLVVTMISVFFVGTSGVIAAVFCHTTAGGSLWWIPALIVWLILFVTTFFWLGAGPLNSP